MEKKRSIGLGLVLATIAAVAVTACGGGDSDDSGSAAQSDAAIRIQGFMYAPSPLEVAAGTTVTWTNNDDILHTATAGTPDGPPGGFDGVMDGPGKSFSHRFEEAGRYLFFCSRHNGMTGEVVVTP